MLVHRGRKSGIDYRAVLEVVEYDRRGRESFVVAGFGRSSDWLRNLQAGGGVLVHTGGDRYVPDFRILEPAEGAAIFAGYERRNRVGLPIVHGVLTRLLGWKYDGSDVARLRLATELPLVGLRPRAAPADRP